MIVTTFGEMAHAMAACKVNMQRAARDHLRIVAEPRNTTLGIVDDDAWIIAKPWTLTSASRRFTVRASDISALLEAKAPQHTPVCLDLVDIGDNLAACRVRIGTQIFDLPIIEMDEDTSAPARIHEPIATIRAGYLAELLGATIPFVAKDAPGRRNLEGVLLDGSGADGRLHAVGCDGQVLSTTWRPATAVLERVLEPSILPLRSARTLARALARIDAPDADVVIHRHGRFMQFVIGEKHIVGVRLLPEPYAEYQKFIPRDPQTRAIIRTADMRNVLAALATTLPPTNHTAVVQIVPDLVTVAGAESPATYRIDARVTGPAITVGFNADHLVAIVAHIRSEEMEMGVSSPVLPAAVTDAGRGISTFVLMPRRV